MAASSAGDVNGDGYGDVIVTGHASGPSHYGRADVYFGSALGLSAIAGASMLAPPTSGGYGFSATGIGDLNADGFTDVAVGAFGDMSDAGAVYVYFGGTSASPTLAARLPGLFGRGGGFGDSVGAAGDVNRDGFDDLIVGENGGPGHAYIFDGSASGIVTTPSATFTGVPGTNFGYSVAFTPTARASIRDPGVIAVTSEPTRSGPRSV